MLNLQEVIALPVQPESVSPVEALLIAAELVIANREEAAV